MRLFSEISRALAREGLSARVQYTVLDGGGAYFQNVKRILSFSETLVIFAGKEGSVRVEGERLSLGKYFAGDAVLRGDVRRVERVG